MHIKSLLTPAFLAAGLALSLVAHAGPVEDAKVKAHLNAVAAGDLEALMKDYAEDAYMDWVGGPLDGRYRGKAAIAAVWQKFIAANNGKPRTARFAPLESYANPKGTSVEAKAEYSTPAAPVKVWHVLTYRDGELTTELWQIAPNLEIAP